MATQILTTPLYYGGHEYTTTATMRVMNPAKPSDLIGEAASATANQALEAVAAAKAAFPEWAATPPKRRAEMLLAASETVMNNAETEAALLSGENGKVVGESTFDLMGLAQRTELACGLADQVDAVDTLPGPPTETLVTHKPMGVVTVIVPFNWPIAILGASMPYALMAGNTVIVKPPPSAPLAITRAVQRMAEKLPAGVLNVVTGEDAEIGSALVSNTDVAKVCFTGSVNGGKRIMSMAAETLTNVLLELGGNDAVLILQDAEFTTENMDALFGGIYGSTGQICMNAKRIYVHASKKQELIDELTARLEQVKLGPASDPETTMGPLHQRSQLEYVNELVQEAKDSGAEVHEFGEIPTGAWAGGNFVRPSLIIDPDPELRVVTEEQFGPTIPIISFDDVEEGIRMVNDTPYGLCNSVWTANEQTAKEVGARLEAGYVFHNTHGAPSLDQRAPFGGIKQSGMGREMGTIGLREFQQPHALGLHKG
ncbi:MAG: aldehyde dehydrogenase family protein [Yaniella sp.]|uniref:aldehyde dehydrogenase family protein n=1 Tax=Yaniella sp. TaxID=2773929 RepID=UPI002647B5BD|nr:aldehyde dehydrogenase family protein [Yaniella sp.]MDN5704940.1 aldehyde dehydrogenase family protein [Yaniella sp.]MDN5732177.1 aldehyde dehydrogenase family protein [Yaniella sp.]MDN6151483.1 aldehyde dehydrogenase family protein [Yaniella sp.]